MSKRFLTVAIAFLILVGINVATPVMAVGEPRLTLSGPATANPGDSMSVVVGIENNPGLVGVRLVVGYDEEYLKLRDEAFEEAYLVTTGFGSPTYAYSNNQVVVLMERNNDAVNWTGDTFITLVFVVQKAGSVAINLSSDDISNAGAQQIEDSILPAQPYTINGSATTAPGAPTIGTATAGDGQATVRFTAPASDGGSPILDYSITATPINPSGSPITQTANISPYTFTGLTNGTEYTFTVTARNSVGTGSASGVSNIVKPNAFNPPATGIADMTGATIAMIMFLILSAALWGYILRRRLISGKNG